MDSHFKGCTELQFKHLFILTYPFGFIACESCQENLTGIFRDVKETVDVRGDDIIMMTGYPKRISDSSMELRYAVLGNDGTAFLISSSVAVNGFESFKSSFAASLNIKIIKVYKISTVPPKSGKNKGKDTDSSTGGLAAGMVILVLCLITAMVLLTYFYKKRRYGKLCFTILSRFSEQLAASTSFLAFASPSFSLGHMYQEG